VGLKYKWKKRPYAHQVLAVKKLLENGWGGALLMEPRTGKTKVVIDYASILHLAGRVNRVLVFCPVSGLGVWEEQIEENCPVPYRITIWDRKTRRGRMRRGSRVQPDLPRYGDDVLDFVIMNYDALSTVGAIIPQKLQICRVKGCGRTEEGHFPISAMKPKPHQFRPGPIRSFSKHPETGEIKRSRRRGGRYTIKNQIKSWQPQLIVLDESHRIKQPTARKTTALVSLRDIPDYRVIMTGTVVTKKKRVFDVYAQWQFLNPDRFGDLTFAEFKHRYGRWIRRNGWEQWIRNINETDLHRKIHRDAFSITREECYDLPPQTLEKIPVELEESADIYDRMAETMVAKIKTGEVTEASIKLVQGMRLRQITSGLARTIPSDAYPKGRLVQIGTEKLRAWRDRLEDLMEADEKVVVGALWTADIARLKAICTKMKVPVFVIRGGMKKDDHTAAWRGFAKVDGGAVFIGQPAAASEAIDLSCASIMQWFSLTPSWVNFRQFSDRIALSDKPTFHEFFLARGTVDELLFETLQQDGDIGKAMITSPERLLRVSGMKLLTQYDLPYMMDE
jgi:SNF2 family DNA or RNA helicase